MIAKKSKPDLQNILSNLEEKHISDQKVFMRKVNSAIKKERHYCPFCLLSFDSPRNLNEHSKEHFARRNHAIKCLTPKIECPLCQKVFFQKLSFQDHLMDNHHVNSSLMQPRVFVKKYSQITKPDQSLKCPICTKKFLKTSIFEKHKLFHRTTSLYECPNCFKSIDSLKKVMKHKSIHMTKERKFECFCCKKDFSKYFSLLSHFQSKVCRWNKKTVKKQVTLNTQENKAESNNRNSDREDVHKDLKHNPDEFLNQRSYEAYPIKVVNSDAVTCSVCQARFTAPSPSRIMESFNNHAKFHTGLYPYECPYCYMGYHSLLEMKIHKRNHILNDTKYTCTVCSTVFKNFSQFRHHLEESGHRNNVNNNPKPNDSDLSLGDSSSDFELECKSTSNTVINIISPKRNYECPLCQTSLGCNSEAFATHIKLHQTSTPNVCQYCFQEFNDKNEVENHLEYNHEDKLYKCPHDEFVTENHSSLLLHFEIENHKSCNNDALENLKAKELENKNYGQDKGLELGKHLNKRSEIECFDQATDNQPYETEQGDTKACKKNNDNNIFSASYKSSELKKCEICFMELGGERSLKSHQKTHLTGFPLECSQCLMGFEDKDKLKNHRKQHQNFFECLSCSEEFETYVRFLKHLEDTKHHDSYKDSYRLHSKLFHKRIELTYNKEEERITDFIDSADIMEPFFKTSLVDMFPEQEDLKFECSKSVSYVLDDELHDLSDTETKEKKSFKTKSNKTFGVEQIQLDFESSDSDDTLEMISRSNIENFCNNDQDENETKTFHENFQEHQLTLSTKISSILTDACSVLSCEKMKEGTEGSKETGPRVTSCFRNGDENKLYELENTVGKENNILLESIKCEEKQKEPMQILSVEKPSHSKSFHVTRMESYDHFEGQNNKNVEILNTHSEDQHNYFEDLDKAHVAVSNRERPESQLNISVKDHYISDAKSGIEKIECLSYPPKEFKMPFQGLEEKDCEGYKICKNEKNRKIGIQSLFIGQSEDEKNVKDITRTKSKQSSKAKINKTLNQIKGLKIENKCEVAEPSSLSQRIPIYKQAFLEPSHQEFFSDKFVNRNMLLKKSSVSSRKNNKDASQNRERKFIERRKFGTLSTKFQGRKKIISNVSFGKDDPFSIEEAEDPAVISTRDKKSYKLELNPSTLQNDVVNEGPNIHSNLRMKEKAETSFEANKKNSIKHTQKLENNEKLTKQAKRNNKEETNKISPSGIEPSCPYCFKILLNQEKMKLHMNQCKRNQEATPTNNLKFKIKLQSDSNSILEKIT